MALIQPCRAAAEPLGDGTQASSQPSLKNVESGSGRQVFGSGWPKIDSVIVPKIPCTTRAPSAPRRGRGSTRAGERSSDRSSVPAWMIHHRVHRRKTGSVFRPLAPAASGSAQRRPANASKETMSAAATRPRGRRRVWLPAIGPLTRFAVSERPGHPRWVSVSLPKHHRSGSERPEETSRLSLRPESSCDLAVTVKAVESRFVALIDLLCPRMAGLLGFGGRHRLQAA